MSVFFSLYVYGCGLDWGRGAWKKVKACKFDKNPVFCSFLGYVTLGGDMLSLSGQASKVQKSSKEHFFNLREFATYTTK